MLKEIPKILSSTRSSKDLIVQSRLVSKRAMDVVFHNRLEMSSLVDSSTCITYEVHTEK